MVEWGPSAPYDVVPSELRAKVGKGDGVLDVDGELLCVFEYRGVSGEVLVIFYRAPGRDLTHWQSRQAGTCVVEYGQVGDFKQIVTTGKNISEVKLKWLFALLLYITTLLSS